eukprot:287289_1
MPHLRHKATLYRNKFTPNTFISLLVMQKKRNQQENVKETHEKYSLILALTIHIKYNIYCQLRCGAKCPIHCLRLDYSETSNNNNNNNITNNTLQIYNHARAIN